MQRNPNFKDLSNKTFGYLTPLYVDKTKNKHTYWFCKCICGKTRVLQSYQLTSGKVTSCGCMNTRTQKSSIIFPNKRMYSVYSSMIARCHNPKSSSYKSYGAKGIKVCDEWKNSFESFLRWSLNHGYNDSLSIDRIDNSKGYNPENCRWIPLPEQHINKTNNVFYTHNNETHTMTEWCRMLDFSIDLAKSRRKQAKQSNIEPTFEYVFSPTKR